MKSTLLRGKPLAVPQWERQRYANSPPSLHYIEIYLSKSSQDALPLTLVRPLTREWQWGIFSAVAGGLGLAFSPVYRGLTFQFKV